MPVPLHRSDARASRVCRIFGRDTDIRRERFPRRDRPLLLQRPQDRFRCADGRLVSVGAEGTGLGSYLAGFEAGRALRVKILSRPGLSTPHAISAPARPTNDRPWAGWLYAGWALQRKRGTASSTGHAGTPNIGVIGPPALAKPVQTEWHKLIGAPEPRGWTHQLPTEPGFVLGYLKKVKTFGNGSVDVIPMQARPWAPS